MPVAGPISIDERIAAALERLAPPPAPGIDLGAADAEWSRLARVVNRLLEMRNERE